MDNNFNDGLNNQPSEQETGNATGFSLKKDDIQSEASQQTVQMQPEMNSQSGFAQPGMNPQSGFAQPGMNPQSGFAQPGMNQQSGFAQPEMNQQSGFAQPGMNQQSGFAQPGMSQQSGFAQPGMNPQMNYTQPGMPAGGMGGDGGSGKPPKVKKPMTGGKIAAIIGGSVALIALIVCGVIFLPKLFKSDKEVVIEAFENTFESESTSSKEDVVGADDILTAYEEKGGSVTMAMTINEVVGEQTDLTMSIAQDIDQVKKVVNQKITAAYQDNEFLKAEIFADEVTAYIAIADMYDGYLSLPCENTADAWANSPVGQYLNLDDMSLTSIDYFSDEDDDSTEIYGGYVDAVETIWDSVTVEKQGKAKIDVNGNTVTAKEYYVTLSEEKLEEAICSALDGAAQAVAADPAALAESGMDLETFNSSIDQVKTYIPSFITGDLVVKVYVKDKKVVKITSAADTSIMTVSLGYDFYFDIDDNAASGGFKVSVAGEEVGIKFNANDMNGLPNGTVTAYMPGTTVDVNFKTTANDDKAFKMDADVMYNADTICTMNFNHENNDNNTYKGEFNCDIMEEGTISLVYEGGISDIEKGVKYTSTIDKLEMSIDDEKILEASFNYTFDTSSVSVAERDSSLPVYDLVNMTESEFENFILDNADNIEAWTNNIINNTGIIGDLFGTGSYDSGSNDIIDNADDEDDASIGTDTDADSEDDTTLVEGNTQVKILGTIDGFELSYACEYFIDYYTDNYSVIEYTIYDDMTVDEVLENMYIPSDDTEIFEQVEKQDIAVGSETAKYSMVQYDSYGSKVSNYRIAKEIADGIVLVVDANIVDDVDSYTVEQLAEALDAKYYEIIAK